MKFRKECPHPEIFDQSLRSMREFLKTRMTSTDIQTLMSESCSLAQCLLRQRCQDVIANQAYDEKEST